MSDAVSDKPIFINIENSLDANGKFEDNNLLQKKAKEKIQRLIKSRLAKVETCDHQDCSYDRKHDTITILGERGSGKTSLLLNLKTILNEHQGKIVFLKIIDPTLFETKQNILVSIISLIADEIQDKDKDDGWNEALVKLADGLKLLDGVGSDIMKSDLFDDGVLILEKGLDHAHSGLNLEKYLNCFISKSLSLLKRKMFVLIFDDIDTNIDKGWMVLETIRKYLTSCQLQVFVSGDWGLYSSLVRMKQWENFDRKTLPEKEWQEKEGLIDQLEEQYLIKVLKPEYRIYLENLYQLTKRSNQIFLEGFNEQPIEIDLIYKYTSQILFNFQNEIQKQEVSNLIKQLPIRTNMKIFYAYLEHQNNTNVEELINAISNVFITNTARYNFTHLDYENLPSHAVLQEMARKLYLISNEKIAFSTLSRFPMNFNDNNLNLLLMVINLHLVKMLQEDRYTFFEWLTRFTFLEVLGKDKRDKDAKDALLSRLKFDSQISMREQIDLIVDAYSSQTTAKSLMPGFKSTYADHGVAKSYGYVGINKFKESNYLDEHFLLSVMSVKSVLVAHSEQTSVSLMSIFSFLSEFLQKDIQDAENYLFSVFEEFHYVKTDDQVFDVFHEERIDDIKNNGIYKSLLKWHQLQDRIEMFSLFQTNRIWEEFIEKFATSDLQNQKFASVKDFIKAQCIAFLNLLIREVLFNKGVTKVYGSVTTITNLYKNIEEAYGENYSENFYANYEKLDFFKYMYLCPLLYCFIDDGDFVVPDSKFWVGYDDKNRILTAFGNLGIHGSGAKEEKLESVDNFTGIEKYISHSDLRKVTDMDMETLKKVVSQIQEGKISDKYQLWNIIKPINKRITSERESILDRFLSNIQND